MGDVEGDEGGGGRPPDETTNSGSNPIYIDDDDQDMRNTGLGDNLSGTGVNTQDPPQKILIDKIKNINLDKFNNDSP